MMLPPASVQPYRQPITGAVARPIKDFLGDKVTVRDFGAVGDGTADDTLAFRAAAAAGRPIHVPWTAAGYRVTGQIDLADGSVFLAEPWERPTIKMVSASTARVFDGNARARCALVNLILDGSGITTTGVMVRFRDCLAPAMEGCMVLSAPAWSSGGTVTLSGATTRAIIRRNVMEGGAATGLYLTGSGVAECVVEGNEFRSLGGFGVFLDGGANRNRITGNFSKGTAKEGIALTHPCAYNRVADNHSEGCGDNGISVSGLYNAVSGNLCLYNQFAGIGVWGSWNSLVGNITVGNDRALTADWAGIWIANGYGGAGQNNNVIGTVIDDDQATATQKWGVRVKGNGYTAWAQGQTIAVGDYRINGLNIYKAASAGTTGATAPTHTTGDVSDGGVTWTYVNAHRSQATPRTNQVMGTQPGRVASGGQQTNDVSSWVNNSLIEYGNLRFNWPTSSAGLVTGQLWKDAAAGNAIKAV